MRSQLGRWMTLGAVLALSASAAVAQGPRVGSVAPEINYKTLEGSRVRLSELRGYPVVVTFWGSWCPPCREEFPALEAAQQRYRKAGLKVLAVNQTSQENREADVRRFLTDFPVSFPVLLDKVGSSNRTWRLISLPTTVFIDSGGVIRQINWGPLPAGELDRGLAAILTPQAVPPT